MEGGTGGVARIHQVLTRIFDNKYIDRIIGMEYPDWIFDMKCPNKMYISLENLEKAVSMFLLINEDQDWAKVDVVANNLYGIS